MCTFIPIFRNQITHLHVGRQSSSCGPVGSLERWQVILVWAQKRVLHLRNVRITNDGIDISIVGEGLDMWGMSSVLYPELLLSDVILANVVVLILGFLASLSPAWRAASYEPIEAITKV